MDFGLSTRLFHAEPLGPGHLEAAAAHGFTAIELYALRAPADVATLTWGRDLAAWCADAGLRLHSVHAPAADTLPRDQVVDSCARLLELAGPAPFSCLVLHGPSGGDATLRMLDALAPQATQAGARLALEVLPQAHGSARQLVRLLEEAEVAGVGVAFDVAHARLGGDEVEALELAGGHVITVDVHDTGGRHDDHRVPFDGVVDWPGVCTALQKIGYDGTLTFELSPGPDVHATLARAAAARRRLETLLGTDVFAFVEE